MAIFKEFVIKLAMALFVLFCLSGCSEERIHTVIICPPIVPYDRATQATARKELIAHGDIPTLGKMLGDYGALRNKIRACSGKG